MLLKDQTELFLLGKLSHLHHNSLSKRLIINLFY